MNRLLQWGVACGLLGMLPAPGPSRGQAPVTASAPGIDPPAAASEASPSQTAPRTLETSRSFAPAPAAVPGFIPVQVQIVPGTAGALNADLGGGFAGVINPGPVSAGTLGAPGLGARTGGVDGAEIARRPVSSYVAGGPGIIGFGPSAAGYFTSSPVNPGAFAVPVTAANTFEAPGAVASGEAVVPTITNNDRDATIAPGWMVGPGPSPTGAGVNTGFGTQAINAGFGTRAINTGFRTQAINTGFGTRSINLGFRTLPGTPHPTQGLTGAGSAGRPPQ
jgi:hypothetical protein